MIIDSFGNMVLVDGMGGVNGSCICHGDGGGRINILSQEEFLGEGGITDFISLMGRGISYGLANGYGDMDGNGL